MAEHNDVFISYRRSDGTEIAEAIYKYLTSKGLHVFLDRQKLVDGMRFDEQIAVQVINAPFYIFVSSTDALRFRTGERDFVAEEMRLAAENAARTPGRILLPVIPATAKIPKEQEFPEGAYPVMMGNAVTLRGVLPTDTELSRILAALCAVSRVSLWHAGRRWLENCKQPGSRFARLCINEAIIPRAGEVARAPAPELPIRVSDVMSGKPEPDCPSAGTEDRPLWDALRDISGHVYLIGEGGIGKTTALISIMERAYEGTEYSENAQIPLFVELSRAPDSYGRVYERDESTFIRRAIYRQLRADLSAKRVSERQVEQIDEEFTADPEVAVRPIDDLLTKETDAPEYLLLLDGLNEVSRAELPEADNYAVVTMIIREIEWIMQNCPNVRVVLTSRTDAAEIGGVPLTRLRLSGVDNDRIRACLTGSGLAPERVSRAFDDPELLETLRIPLFLTMYAGLGNAGELRTRGEILRTFFHERSRNIQDESDYTARSRVTEVFDDVRTAAGAPQKQRMTAEAQHFMLDFLLPEIAYRMEQADAFYLKRRQMKKIAADIVKDRLDTAVCGEYGTELFEKYGPGRKNTAAVAKALREKYGDDNDFGNAVTDCCIYTLGILQETDNGVGFIHHHIRDYFAAVRNVNMLRLAVYIFGEDEPDLARDCLADLRERPLSPEMRRFIGEYLREDRNRPLPDENGVPRYCVPEVPCDRNLLKRALAIFRGRFDGTDGYSVYNLLQPLSDVRKDLSGADLRALDLRHCSLGSVTLGNPGCGAVLTGALLTENNILPTGHLGRITCLTYDPDGNTFATASVDRTVKIWDAHTLRLLGTSEGHTDVVNCIAYSPDGQFLASASHDHTIQIRDPETFRTIRTLKGHSNAVNSISYSPDGHFLLSTSKDRTVRIWDSRTFELIHTLEGHTDGVNNAVYGADGTFIVSASRDQTIRIWDARTYEPIRVLKSGSAIVNNVSVSPDGRFIVSGTGDIWDCQSFELIHKLRGHTHFIHSCIFSPDSRLIVSASGDIWDSRSFELIHTMNDSGPYKPTEHISFSPDGRIIVIISGDENVRFRNSRTFELLGIWERVLYDCVNTAVYSPDGLCFAGASDDDAIRIWDSLTLRLLRTVKLPSAPKSAAYSPDGRFIVCTFWDKAIQMWDARDLKPPRILKGPDRYVNTAVYSPDGRFIVGASGDHTVRIWDSRTCELIHTSEGHSHCVYSAAFSPDGHFIVSTAGDHTVKIWDGETYELLHSLKDTSNMPHSAVFSPDGYFIICVLSDDTIQIRDARTYELVRTLEGHSAAVNSVAFSPDGRFFISASDDRTINIRDSRTYALLHTLKGHSDAVYSASFSPDGQFILSASADGTMRIWDAGTYECVQVIRNVPGLSVIDCDMRRLHPASSLSEDARLQLKKYGAVLD